MPRHLAFVAVLGLAALAAYATLAGAARFQQTRCLNGQCNTCPNGQCNTCPNGQCQQNPQSAAVDRVLAIPARSSAPVVTTSQAATAAVPQAVILPTTAVSQSLPARTMETHTPAVAPQSLPARTMETHTPASGTAATLLPRVVVPARSSYYRNRACDQPSRRRGLFGRWR
jgi:hypothetical protein